MKRNDLVHSDEEKGHDQQKDDKNDQDNDRTYGHVWNLRNSYNWEPELMTIFVPWQIRVTLDRIHNSWDVSLCWPQNFTIFQLWAAIILWIKSQDLSTPLCYTFHNRQELNLLMVRPWIYVVKSKSRIILTKLTNCYVFCLIFGCPSKKFNWLPIGQYWRQRASQYLIWKVRPNVFEGTCLKWQDF